MDVKPILRAGLVAQSAALAGDNLRLLRKKKKKSGDFIGQATRNIVGTSLLKAEAEFIEGF